MDSDKSQPIKLVLMVFAIGVVLVLGIKILDALKINPLGVSFSEPGFGTSEITRSQITCSTANASTSVLAASQSRSSFMAANAGANKIFLCRGTGACSATSGIPIVATSTGNGIAQIFEQRDGYTGIYTCRADTADTPLTILYSQ